MAFFSFSLLKGDSGGLLTCGNKKMLDGIVSFGYACGSATFPGKYFSLLKSWQWNQFGFPFSSLFLTGVYTDVSKYKEWIDMIINSTDLPVYEHSLIFYNTSQTEAGSGKSDSLRINVAFVIIVTISLLLFV